MDPFVKGLLGSSKSARWASIRRELTELATKGEVARVLSIVQDISGLGRNWHSRIVHTLIDLSARESTSPLAQIVSAFIASSGKTAPIHRELLVYEKETGSTVRDLQDLLVRLEGISHRPRPVLDIVFETPQVYVYGLCAIAAWAAAHAASISIRSPHSRVEDFLQRAGVVEALDDPTSDPVKFDTDTILGFTRIDPGVTFRTDAHAGRLVELFRRHQTLNLNQETAVALSICFSELIENALKHGEISSPAWLFANYHPRKHLLHVCICDRGLGVRKTFANSTSSERLRTLARHSTNWIREATEPLVTSKAEGHAGYGLYITRELCRRNGGTFEIISENAAFVIRPSSPESILSEIEEVQELPVSWRGTLLALQFRLDRTLDVGPIYASLPSPDADSDDSLQSVNLFDE